MKRRGPGRRMYACAFGYFQPEERGEKKREEVEGPRLPRLGVWRRLEGGA